MKKPPTPPSEAPGGVATALESFQEAMSLPTDESPPERKRGRPKAAASDDDISAALHVANGLLTPAAKVLGITRQALAKLLKPSHKALIEDLREVITDMAEEKLFRQIQFGDERSVQFWLTRQGKNRGYSEKQEIKVETGGAVDSKAREANIRKLFKGFDQDGKA